MALNNDNKEFITRAKYCSMGDLPSMLWMWEYFQNRLSEETLHMELDYLMSPSMESWNRLAGYLNTNREESIYTQAANFWLCRAGLYGSQKAAALLEKIPERENLSFFTTAFQQPGKNKRRSSPGSPLIRFCGEEVYTSIGLLEFSGRGSCCLDPMDERGIYRAEAHVSCEGPDETGFGMEEEYDFSFYDEFFCFLFVLRGWSRVDMRISSNAAYIREQCRQKREEKAREREQFKVFF